MRRAEAEAYLDEMFGTRAGYVAVAYKDKEASWQERTFKWPQQRAQLLGWADVHQDSNVFICPALRRSGGRKQGDAHDTRWLWADVDWDKVPADKRAQVRARIKQVGTMVMGSGSGDNAHVYVKLSRALDVEEHYRLNTGLRDYLYADAKHADNSLLRLPGTTNWKTEAGTPVRPVSGHRRAINPDAFAKLETFANVRVSRKGDVSDTWTREDPGKLSLRVRRLLRMERDEGDGRFGSRHSAVWAMAGELIKAGLNVNQVHTAMEKFKPGLSKEDEENGYSMHRDIARRWGVQQQLTEAMTQASLDGPEGIDDSPFEDIPDDEIAAAGPSNPLVQRILRERDARREADAYEASRHFMAPPPDVSWCAADALAHPPAPQRHLIADLAGIKHNVVIAAQYKTGKTSFTIASLAKSLADGVPFLDQFAVPEEGRVIGHWNCEMEANEILDDYIRPAGIENEDRLHVANLRGYSVNILTAPGKAWAVEWLRSRGVQVWTIDSLARLLHMAGVSEKDNDETLGVLMAIDEIKLEAGVDACFIIAHTGRAEVEEGKEHVRGATVVDDWADARWIMTKDGEIRFLAVDGRGVKLATQSLVFDPETKGSIMGGESKAEAREGSAVQHVLSLCVAHPGITKTALQKLVRESLRVGLKMAAQHITDAIEGGFIETRPERNPKGGMPLMKHYAATDGSKRSGGATPRVMNMRNQASSKQASNKRARPRD